MKLLLTSNGISSKKLRTAFASILEQKIQESKVLVVHTAQKPEHMTFVDKVGKEISLNGILLPNITYLNIAKEKDPPNLSDYDAVYVCGGNTYFILDRMRKTGLDKSIKRYVKSGGIYIGVSAGSIIAGQDIRIAGWGSEKDYNRIRLRDLNGLEFTKIAIFPHYMPQLRKEIEEFRKVVNYPVEVLKDGEALLINGNKKFKM
jgi:peptidase E